MATCFNRWEKDPFFPAAEEVQDSADRMESVYRRWIHEKKDAANSNGDAISLTGDLLQELHTTLGTAKWQLEELERAVKSNDDACSAGEDTRTRHTQFVEAIGNQISNVEKSLKESNLESGESKLSWVRLDEGERDDLAIFLSSALPPMPHRAKIPVVPHVQLEAWKNVDGENGIDGLKNECCPKGHRRTASASADIETWKISLPNEEKMPHLPPPKTHSFSSLTKMLESTPKMNWPKNGFRKWKGGDQHQEEETIPLRNHEISQGLNACYERSKSYLSGCGDGAYDKQLYGWLGVFHRQLQRSQYQIQYGCSVQIILFAIAVVLFIALFGLCAI